MNNRYAAIWFCNLKTDWYTRRQPHFGTQAFVLYTPQNGRMVITAVNKLAVEKGIRIGTVLADAKAVVPGIFAAEEQPDLFEDIVAKFAEWFIRYSPVVATDFPDGLTINATGCTHLWGSEEKYLTDITTRLKGIGYTVRAAIASTIGTAWAVCRYGNNAIVKKGDEVNALGHLPSSSLRISEEAIERLNKLGLKQNKNFLAMPVSVLRRRFGHDFIKRLHQALGIEEEIIFPVKVMEPYHERLYCIDPIKTLTGIEIALHKLIEAICHRLLKEQKGLRSACMKVFRIDGNTQKLHIGTNRPTNEAAHIFKLFELKLQTIEPDLGIELFLLEALVVEDYLPAQQKLWSTNGDLNDNKISLLIDRLSNKIGEDKIHRYLPDTHYWPERCIKKAASLTEKATTKWLTNKPRPLRMLPHPEPISVTAPVPDYPPMLFRHNGKVHKIVKADGPERIEQEWWIEEGLHRDYYYVEDEEGNRYWLFRAGHYEEEKTIGWFLHGYCA